MTTVYYGCNPHDGGPDTVTTGTSTTGKALEVVLDNTKITSEAEVLQCLVRIQAAIQQKRLNIA